MSDAVAMMSVGSAAIAGGHGGGGGGDGKGGGGGGKGGLHFGHGRFDHAAHSRYVCVNARSCE